MNYLGGLPNEVLLEIGHWLDRESISKFSRVCRHVQTATIPLLFSKSLKPFDLQNTQWISTALRSVDPDTWRYVKELHITIKLPYNRTAFEMDRTRPDTAKNRDCRTMWRSFFRHLNPLTKLSISISDETESPEAAHDIVVSDWWLDYASLLRDSETLYGLIPSSKLILDLVCCHHNHPTSDFMKRLLRPLTSYKNTGVNITLATENRQVVQAGTAQLGELFSNDWVKQMSVHSGQKLALIVPFKTITRLGLRLKQETISVTFWKHFTKLSPRLEMLRIEESDLPELVHVVLREPIVLSELAYISASGFSVSTLAHLAKLSHFPALDSITVNLNCLHNETRRRHTSVVISLRSLLMLNAALPRHCKPDDRQYTLTLEGDLQELQALMVMVTPLAVTGTLVLHIVCNFKNPVSNIIEMAGTQVPQYCDVKALATAIPPKMRQLLQSLHIKLGSNTLSRVQGCEGMVFPNLTNLIVSVDKGNEKWSTHVLHQLFLSLSLPKVSHLRFVSHARMHINMRYVDMLEIFLSDWSSLGILELKTSRRANEPEIDVTALWEACKARHVVFKKVYT